MPDYGFTYYDKQGRAISRERMAALSEDTAYRVVAETVTTTGWRVSTVWMLGIDHSHGQGGGPPILFESMVFGPTDEVDQARYTTEDNAREGHALLVKKWSNPLRDAKFRLGDREDMDE